MPETKTPTAENLRKVYTCKVEDGPRERTLKFILSTAAEDSASDTIAVAGWKLDRFKRNPVILWNHDTRIPAIGRGFDPAINGLILEAFGEFATADVDPFADHVFKKLKAGFLNQVSVGFNPLKWMYNETRGGFDFIEQELLEFSVVNLGANSEAEVQRALAASKQAPPPEPPETPAMKELAERLAKIKGGE